MQPSEAPLTKMGIAVEDRFIVVRLDQRDRMLPEGILLETVAFLLSSFRPRYTVLCDARGLAHHTHDVRDAVKVLSDEAGAHVIATDDQTDEMQQWLGDDARILSVKPGPLPLGFTDTDVGLLDTMLDQYVPDARALISPLAEAAGSGLPTKREWEFAFPWLLRDEESGPSFDSYEKWRDYWRSQSAGARRSMYSSPEWYDGSWQIVFRRAFARRLQEIGTNSLLTHFAVQVAGEQTRVVPYHSHAVHSLETRHDLLMARPAVLARVTGALLRDDVLAFEGLLQRTDLRERDIQQFFEAHPNLLRMLGYAHVYPQVVLQRDDGSSLVPDFILEPLGTDWCDILDVKLPTMPTIVGTRDRKRLAAGIHELAAQLREYGAYFEDPRLAARVEQKYGIKCYRPRLFGIAGFDLRLADERQLRRLSTAYTDVSVLTFDQMLRMAKKRMLI